MKMCKKGVIATLLTLGLCVGMLAQTVMAAEVKGASVNVKTVLSGTLPEKAEEFTMQLTADDSSVPMPEGSKDNVYSMTIAGAGEKAFPAVVYDKLGIYHYTIKQLKGTNKDCTYDESVYSLTVYVTNSETEEGKFDISYTLYKNDGKEKLDEVIFKNVYKTVVPTVPKTGDESDLLSNMIIMAGSAMLVVFLGIVSHKRRKNNN